MPGDWVVPLPHGLRSLDAMTIGTAGFTAALSIMELERNGLRPGSGPVMVTGASGGVGSLAVDCLARLGYEVVAMTGKPDQRDYLLALGAREVIPRGVPGDAAPLGRSPLGRRDRPGGRGDAGRGAANDAVRRRRRQLWSHRRRRPGDHGAAVHLARRQAARHRLGAVPDAAARRGLAAPRGDMRPPTWPASPGRSRWTIWTTCLRRCWQDPPLAVTVVGCSGVRPRDSGLGFGVGASREPRARSRAGLTLSGSASSGSPPPASGSGRSA